jgi:hypothetical protein
MHRHFCWLVLQPPAAEGQATMEVAVAVLGTAAGNRWTRWRTFGAGRYEQKLTFDVAPKILEIYLNFLKFA